MLFVSIKPKKRDLKKLCFIYQNLFNKYKVIIIMSKKCAICNEVIIEESGKLKGTIVKAKDENNKNQLIYVCSDCQKKDGWIDKAKIKAA